MAAAFIDTARITVRAGSGGNGAVAFHREKYVAAGGPDGGDGGRRRQHHPAGGRTYLSTLMDFRYKRKYVAENGADGQRQALLRQGRTASGHPGAPGHRGPGCRDAARSSAICPETSPSSCAKGGKGGWGNKHFATPTRQVPRFAKAGLPGQSREVILELKLLADVGLVGFPNVGKSTLLSVVTKAQPKIANYHFTTLSPQPGRGVRGRGRQSFVLADIPGIIEGRRVRAPAWVMTFCGTLTAAACSSTWWMCPAARDGTRWPILTPSAPSSSSTVPGAGQPPHAGGRQQGRHYGGPGAAGQAPRPCGGPGLSRSMRSPPPPTRGSRS